MYDWHIQVIKCQKWWQQRKESISILSVAWWLLCRIVSPMHHWHSSWSLIKLEFKSDKMQCRWTHLIKSADWEAEYPTWRKYRFPNNELHTCLINKIVNEFNLTPWPRCSTATIEPTFPRLHRDPAVIPGSHMTLQWNGGKTAYAAFIDRSLHSW